MTMISCPDCKAQISDKASACVKCGCPIQGQQNPPLTGGQIHSVLNIGPCAKCGSEDTGDMVAEEGRKGTGLGGMLGTRTGSFLGGGRYYCRRCGHRWRYNG